MNGFEGWKRDDPGRPARGRVEAHQLKAAAAPHLSIRQLAGEEGLTDPLMDASGNFADFDSLLEQLGSPPVYELGNPKPDERYLPRRRVGDCPASHNRALLDEDGD